MMRRSILAGVSLAMVVIAAGPALAQHEPRPTLFESDMSRMTGMTADDPMAGSTTTRADRPATRRSSRATGTCSCSSATSRAAA